MNYSKKNANIMFFKVPHLKQKIGPLYNQFVATTAETNYLENRENMKLLSQKSLKDMIIYRPFLLHFERNI